MTGRNAEYKLPKIVVVLVAVLVVFELSAVGGSVSEATAAVGVAACIIGLALVVGLAPLVRLATRPLAVALVVGLGVLVGSLAILPVVETLTPGGAAAVGDLQELGGSVSLPAGLGPARVLVRASLPSAPSHLRLDIQAGEQALRADLSRTRASVRLGRRGRGAVERSQESAFVDASLAGVDRLVLKRATGPWPVPVHLAVFREWVPDRIVLVGVFLMLFLSAWLAAETGIGSRTPVGVGCALFFGVAVHAMATPDSALRPEIGALFVAGFASILIAPTLTLVWERLRHKHVPEPDPSSA